MAKISITRRMDSTRKQEIASMKGVSRRKLAPVGLRKGGSPPNSHPPARPHATPLSVGAGGQLTEQHGPSDCQTLHGVKPAGTLFSRLILDLNRASEAVERTIAELREITSGLMAVFLAFCTTTRESPFRSRVRSIAPGGAVIAALPRRPFHPTNRTATAGGWPTCTPRWHVLGRGQQWRNLSNGENRRHTAQPWATWASGRAVMGFAGRLGAIVVSGLGSRTAHGIKPSR
jgi:hypothetical protein